MIQRREAEEGRECDITETLFLCAGVMKGYISTEGQPPGQFSLSDDECIESKKLTSRVFEKDHYRILPVMRIMVKNIHNDNLLNRWKN